MWPHEARSSTRHDIGKILPLMVSRACYSLVLLGGFKFQGEGLALRRVMRTLATGEGQFSDADIYSLSKKTCGLISILLEMRDLGRYSPEQ